MLKFLNRLAWGVSLFLGFLFLFLLGVLFDALDTHAMLDDGFFIIWIILIFCCGSIFKKMLFSKQFIKNHLIDLISGHFEKEDKVTPKSVIHDNEVWNEEALASKQDDSASAAEKEEIKNESPDVGVSFSTLDKAEVLSEVSTNLEEKFERFDEVKLAKPSLIKQFFSENLLAKVGGILLFLGVLFLLGLVYDSLGAMGKLMIGFVISVFIFGVGVYLEKKKLVAESHVLFGTSILINYLVILAGRFLIKDIASEVFLTEGVTFFLLILNTIFAVLVSMIYRSHILLVFSFAFAFLNPFLINSAGMDTPFTLVGYGMIVALGAAALTMFDKNIVGARAKSLLVTAFVGGNILFLMAPFETSEHWILKLVATAVLSLLIIVSSYRKKLIPDVGTYFFGTYAFLIILMLEGGTLADFFDKLAVNVSYLSFLIVFVFASAIFMISTAVKSVFYTLIMPLFILLALFMTDSLEFSIIAPVLAGTVILYLGVFIFINGMILNILKIIFFIVIGIFIFLTSGVFGLTRFMDVGLIPPNEILSVFISALIFLGASYYYSSKKGLNYLYFIGTLFSILMLLPIIDLREKILVMSILSIVVLVLANVICPFVNKNIVTGKLQNLVFGLALGALFGVGEIFFFSDKYFSGIELGLAFLGFAVFYFLLGFVMFNKLGASFENQTEEEKVEAQNVVLSLLGIAISLFSLAIVYIFSKNNEIVSAVWLFEASLMFFFFGKTKNWKIYIAGIILMLIGLVEMASLLPLVNAKEFMTLIPLSVILGSFVVNLKSLEKTTSNMRNFHDVLHLVGALILGILLLIIIPSTGHGWSTMGIAAALTVLAVIYNLIYSGIIKYVFVIVFIGFCLMQNVVLEDAFTKVEVDKVEYLKLLQFVSLALLGGVVYLFERFDKTIWKTVVKSAFLLHLFVITTQLVYLFSNENTFMITIYWGILAFGLSGFGINKDMVKYRTLGLYILMLVVGKILLMDVWGVVDSLTRVLALMLVGGLMVVMSILYSKKYGNNWKEELDLNNLIGE